MCCAATGETGGERIGAERMQKRMQRRMQLRKRMLSLLEVGERVDDTCAGAVDGTGDV